MSQAQALNIKYVEPATPEALAALITSVDGSVKRMNHALQILAVGVLYYSYHVEEDTKAKLERVTDICNRYSGSLNGAALVKWFTEFGGFVPSAKGFSGWAGKKHIKDNMDKAKAQPWWTFKAKNNPFAGFDAEESLTKFIGKYNATQKKMKDMKQEDKDKVSFVVSAKTIELLLKMVNFEPIQVQPIPATTDTPVTTDGVDVSAVSASVKAA